MIEVVVGSSNNIKVFYFTMFDKILELDSETCKVIVNSEQFYIKLAICNGPWYDLPIFSIPAHILEYYNLERYVIGGFYKHEGKSETNQEYEDEGCFSCECDCSGDCNSEESCGVSNSINGGTFI